MVPHSSTRKHCETVREKAGLSDSELEVLLDSLFDEIVMVPDSELVPKMQAAYSELGDKDPDDVPYLAAAFSKHAAIWSDDNVFDDHASVETYTTTEMVETFGIP